jgi:prevent-host-death family protein
MASWALQDAKGHFSEVVERARRDGPQIVTRHGEEAVVIVSAEQFRQLTRRGGADDLVGFFAHSPLAELKPEWLTRDRDKGREVAL